MIKRIAGIIVRLGSLRVPKAGERLKSALNWAPAVFTLLLLLVAPLLPRAFGQSRTHAGNQNLPQNLPKTNQSQLLRYDVRPNPTVLRGFYDASGMLAHISSG